VRSLPPPAHDPGPLPDLGEGFDAVAREAIEIGEQALTDLRENSAARWISAGAAWKALQNVALHRSGSNSPSGQRYNRVYAILVYAWPQLAKVDKATRSHAIWLFDNRDNVLAWLATLTQNQRDQWTHPRTLRQHYEKRYPKMLPDKPPPPWRDRNRHHRAWKREKLGERSRDDLEALIGELGEQLADRERHIIELEELLTEKDREIARLRNDLACERATRMQLEAAATPAAAPVTVVRPDGETAEIVHAVSRQSQEIVPPESYGRPDYGTWALLVAERIEGLSTLELYWLLADNSAHLEAYEAAYPGAGAGLRDRINVRIAELAESQ
jgi:hypothetical protein